MTPYWRSEDGRAAIYCGDALEALRHMADSCVAALVTDAPYGSSKTSIGSWHTHGRRGAPKTWTSDFGNWDVFDPSWISEAAQVLRDGTALIAFCPDWAIGRMKEAGETAGLRWRQTWYWRKPNPPMTFRGVLQFAVEPMVYFAKGMHAVRVGNTGRAHNVFEYSFPTDPNRRYHPNQKPVDLMRHILRLVMPTGGTVLDCFAGSGSTGVAAMREGFGCILIEQDERYCDIAVERLKRELRQLRLPLEADV